MFNRNRVTEILRVTLTIWLVFSVTPPAYSQNAEAYNGFFNRDSIDSAELNGHGFAVSSGTDINSNGFGEFVVLSKSPTAELKIYEAAGNDYYVERSSFDLPDGIGENYPIPYLITVGNIDSDDNVEILITYINDDYESLVRIFDVDPYSLTITEHPYSPAPNPGNIPLAIAVLGDTDNDGLAEFVTATQDSLYNLSVYEWNNSGWNTVSRTDAGLILNMAAADVTGDGLKEIVLTTGEGLKIYSFDGSNLENSGKVRYNYSLNYGDAQLTIGDIDRNGTNEIVVSFWDLYPEYRSGIYIYEYRGNNRYNRDDKSDDGIYGSAYPVYVMDIGDHDSNGYGEIYFSDNGNTVDYLEFSGSTGRFTADNFNDKVNIFNTGDKLVREISFVEGTHPYLDNDNFRDIVVLTEENDSGPELFVLESESEDISLPVTLTKFSATVQNGFILIEWETASEVNNAGFMIERSNDGEHYVKIAEIEGAGNANYLNHYNYRDYNVLSGEKYFYRLADYDFGGNVTYHETVTATADMSAAERIELYPNYPNPFNPNTTLRFYIPDLQDLSTEVRVDIYNIQGQLISCLFRGNMNSGVHTLEWNGRNDTGNLVPSGMYLVRVIAGPYIKTQKIMLVK